MNHQIPLSLPVILYASAATDASGGSSDNRNAAAMWPFRAASFSSLVYSVAPCGMIGTRRN